MKNLLTVNEAAELLNVTPVHVRRLAHSLKLVSQKTTQRKTMITRKSIEALIDENNNRQQHETVDAN